MFQKLFISNLVLIETIDISFSNGLNILSGETGAGKSAIMEALKLAMGQRADAGLIRKGADKGIVEAHFEISDKSPLKSLLVQHDIEWMNPLCIRREITVSGKSRALINDQVVSLTLLKQVGEELIDIVGQHANQRLLEIEQHRLILDTYGELIPQVKAFHVSWNHEVQCRKKLEEWVAGESARIRELENCKNEFEEIQEAQLKEGEEEELFAEYSLLNNSEDRVSKANEILHGLNQAQQILRKNLNGFEQLQNLDPTLQETADIYRSALIEAEEVSSTLTHYLSKIEVNPYRLKELDDRLGVINRLKRKYGPTATDVLNYSQKLEEKLNALQESDTLIEQLQEEIEALEEKHNHLSQQITLKRTHAARQLEKALQIELKALNMPKVVFDVQITPQKRSGSGDDRIEFYLIPNVGEHKISIKDCASGGELSRIMLALQTLLAGKASIPTLVFDEIDANIGGATAVVVGQKLKQLGQQHQVLCITHFPQVASQADHHLQIAKIEKAGRTVSIVTLLDEKMREQELLRMKGLEPQMNTDKHR